MKFIENVKASFSDDAVEDDANLVETILIIAGFSAVALVLIS